MITSPMSQSDSLHRLTRLSTYAAVLVALVIVVIKLVAWILTDSLSLLASLVDSFLDIVASTVNLVAVHYALQPPDEEHRFGHQKAEDLAALSQAIFIAASSFFLIVEAGKRFFFPESISNGGIGIVVMTVSLLLTVLLVFFQHYVVKKTGSGVVAADKLHYTSDILANLLIIGSLVLSSTLHIRVIDPFFAVLVAAYILYNAWEIGIQAFHNLMDREFKDSDRQIILDIIQAHPDVKGIHALKTRLAGTKPFIQFHLEMDGKISLHKAHHIADDIEARIMQQFPQAEVLIHQDPYRG